MPNISRYVSRTRAGDYTIIYYRNPRFSFNTILGEFMGGMIKLHDRALIGPAIIIDEKRNAAYPASYYVHPIGPTVVTLVPPEVAEELAEAGVEVITWLRACGGRLCTVRYRHNGSKFCHCLPDREEKEKEAEEAAKELLEYF